MDISIEYMQKDITIIYLWGKNMTLNEAIKFCEDHDDCSDCPVKINGDKRTEDQKWRHMPCCMNLVSEQERQKYGL